MQANYILKLTDDKWYVGFSNDLDSCLYKTWNGQGALWTQKHSPVEVIDIVPGERYTKQLTLMMMREYGVNNVRGHCWSQRKLNPKTIKLLQGRIGQ